MQKKKVNSYAKLHECNLAFSTAGAKRAKSIENRYFSLNAAMVLVELFFIGSFVAFTLLDGYLARRFCRTKCFPAFQDESYGPFGEEKSNVSSKRLL